MRQSRSTILNDVLAHIQRLADDWEYDGEITEETTFFGDMGLESLDIVVLATAVQEQYRMTLPFSEFFAEIGQRARRDVTVGEWVDFIHSSITSYQESADSYQPEAHLLTVES